MSLATRNTSRSPSLSPTSMQRDSPRSQVSSQSRAHITSPTGNSHGNLGDAKNRSSTVAPCLSPKRHGQISGSRLSSLSPSPDLKSSHGNMTNRNYAQRHSVSDAEPYEDRDSDNQQGYAPHRDIFSPVPSERVPVEGLDDTASGIVNCNPSDKAGSYQDSANSFPSIKVENCDDSPRGHRKNTKDMSGGKKSAAIPDLPEEISLDETSATGTSLNVPSPLVKRRTTDGRLIVGVNDDVSLAGSLSRMWSRSEGNLPHAFGEHDTRHENSRSELGASRSHSDNPLSGKYSRYSYGSHSAHLGSNTSKALSAPHRHQLLSAKLPTSMVSKPNIRASPEPTEADIRRNIRFHSPQPKRKLSPKH